GNAHHLPFLSLERDSTSPLFPTRRSSGLSGTPWTTGDCCSGEIGYDSAGKSYSRGAGPCCAGSTDSPGISYCCGDGAADEVPFAPGACSCSAASSSSWAIRSVNSGDDHLDSAGLAEVSAGS